MSAINRPLPLDIVKDEAALRVPCTDVTAEMLKDPDFVLFLDRMMTVVLRTGALGLAANQVGRNVRAIVVRQWQGGLPQVYINPRITPREEYGHVLSAEGCLSIPGVEGKVRRWKRIWVEALDRDGVTLTFQEKAPRASVFQHEVDHLDGVLFTDKLA